LIEFTASADDSNHFIAIISVEGAIHTTPSELFIEAAIVPETWVPCSSDVGYGSGSLLLKSYPCIHPPSIPHV